MHHTSKQMCSEIGQDSIDNNRKEDKYFQYIDVPNNNVELVRFVEYSDWFSRQTEHFSVMEGYTLDIGCNYNSPRDEINPNGEYLLYSR